MGKFLTVAALLSVSISCATNSNSRLNEKTLSCFLRYAQRNPYYAFQSATQSLSWENFTVKNTLQINDDRYYCSVSLNKNAPENLILNSILGRTGSEPISYSVTPMPNPNNGKYLFELGARIPINSWQDEKGIEHSFESINCYCSLQD